MSWSRRPWSVVIALSCVAAGWGIPAGAEPTPAARFKAPSSALAPVAAKDPYGHRGYLDSSGWRSHGGRYPFTDWAEPDRYQMMPNPTGKGVMVLDVRGRSLRLRGYNDRLRKRQWTRTVRLAGWWPGASTVGPDGAVYVLLGRHNYRDRLGRAVIAIRKYDTSLQLLDEVTVPGSWDLGGAPVAGAPSLTWSGTSLVARLGRHFLTDENGLRHQGSLGVMVDTSTMDEATELGYPVSHSFNQFARTDGDDVVFVDHGDAYPRAVNVQVVRDVLDPTRVWCAPDDEPAEDPWEQSCEWWKADDYRPVRIVGKRGDNYTGLTVNGAGTSEGRVLVVGASLPQHRQLRGVTGNKPRLLPNVYLSVTDLATGSTRYRWMTRFSPRGKVRVGQPTLTSLGDGRHVLLYEVRRGRRTALHYRLLDGAGATLAGKKWKGTRFSPLSEPLLHRDRLVWVGLFTDGRVDDPRGGHFLTGLDLGTPERPKPLRR